MLAATLLGVFFIPALFVGVEKLATRKGGEKPSPTPTTAPTPEPVAPSPAPSVTS